MELKHSLEVYAGNELIFFSDRNWVYPLLDLEQHLGEHCGTADLAPMGNS